MSPSRVNEVKSGRWQLFPAEIRKLDAKHLMNITSWMLVMFTDGQIITVGGKSFAILFQHILPL